MLKVVVSREAHLLAELYDLFHVYGEERNPAYLFYHGSSSELLYYGYLLEDKGLWKKAFELVVGLSSDHEVLDIVDGLKKVEVYGWGLIKDMLKKHGDKLVGLYSMKEDRIQGLLKRILGVKRFFKEIYTILAFNPLRGLIGSLPVYSGVDYAIATLFVNPSTSVEKTLDLLIHELIHGLIRVNELDVPEDYEEEFIDTLCPEGYLSRELGLVEEVDVGESRLAILIDKYFSEKLYNELTLIDYIKLNRNGNYLL